MHAYEHGHWRGELCNAASIDAACLCIAARGSHNEPRCEVCDARRWVDACDSVTGPDELADLVNNLHLPESTDVLKTIVCSNLADTAQYSEAFARRVVEAQALPAVAMQVCASSSSTKLAAAALLCLGQVAKHSDALAAEVLDQGVAQATLEAAMSQVLRLHDSRLQSRHTITTAVIDMRPPLLKAAHANEARPCG